MGSISISAQNLSREFGGGAKRVLAGASFEAREGERVAIVGANGSGKTTLLRILATLISPTSGDVLMHGHSVLRDPRPIRALVGWAPSVDNGFFPRLSGLENLMLFGALRRLDRREVERALAPWRRIGAASEALATPFYLCSAGMKQALTLCRAFLADPKIVLLDEPTRSLDIATADECLAVINEISKGKTLIMASHRESDEQALGARRLRLERGGFA